MSELRGGASSASECVFGRGVREAGTRGGQVGLPRVRSLRGPGLPLWKGDSPSLALSQSLPGIWHKSVCLSNEDDCSGCDLNFVTSTLCPRTVTLSTGLTRVAVQTCAEVCPLPDRTL